MEVIMIEARTFEAMMAGFESLARNLEMFCRQNGDKGMQKWLDIQEVCEMLKISKRTLQSYRDHGIISFSRIENKTYYRPQDVEQVINNLKIKPV